MSLWAAWGKAAQAVSLPWSWRATSLGPKERAVRNSYITPNQPARGVCAPAARAVPLWMWLGRRTLPAPGLQPLPISPLPRSPGSPGPVRAWWFCCSKCTWVALFWAETAAQDFFFFHFISGRALELCSLPLPPSSPPAELLPGPVSFPGVPFCSQLLFNIHFFCPLSPSVLLPKRQITNHKLCYSSNRS